MILSFNMCEEMFYCIELPNEIRPAESHWRCSLMVWNDSFALLYDKCPHGYRTSDLRSIDIWVMDDNNDGGGKGSYSWIKYLALENLIGMLAPLKFWKSDELLMKYANKEKFVTYNIHKKRFRDLDIGGPRQNGVSYLGTHASSLVRRNISMKVYNRRIFFFLSPLTTRWLLSKTSRLKQVVTCNAFSVQAT
ncbi:hypothetical protein TIFTF001_010151 [Ficus carica]|uniref:Uncharacterized protein n=1 Tax=Ficus carica TaxID=3494 RepID=A0AA87ZR69_FICCA|nr:hypothetical protein TIFTF001_010151 [Ficus carica]